MNFGKALNPRSRAHNEVQANQLNVCLLRVTAKVVRGSCHQSGAGGDQVCYRLGLGLLLIRAKVTAIGPPGLFIVSTATGLASTNMAAKNAAELVHESSELFLFIEPVVQGDPIGRNRAVLSRAGY